MPVAYERMLVKSLLLISLTVSLDCPGQNVQRQSIYMDRMDSVVNSYKKDKLLIGPYLTLASIENFSPKVGLGVSAEYFLGRQFAFSATMAFGPDYAEFSSAILGLLGLAAWETSNSSSNGFFLVLMIPLVIESPTVHFGDGSDHDLSLSLNLLKFRYIYEKNTYFGEDNIFASAAITLRYSLYNAKHWRWSFFAEGTSLYYPGAPKGFQFGVALRHLSRKP